MVDAQTFRADWEANGPTVPGLDPMDATDRLRKFQQVGGVGVGPDGITALKLAQQRCSNSARWLLNSQ